MSNTYRQVSHDEEMQRTKNAMKACSTLPIIKEMQIFHVPKYNFLKKL